MIRALVIEDEQPIQELITALITETEPEIVIAGICDNAITARELIQTRKPQLVFLDIMLPGATAFDLLKSLDEIDFEIIFITAHNDFIADAIRYAANGYIVKPISQPDLKQAIDNARKRIMKGLNAREVVSLLEGTLQKRPSVRKLAVSTFNEYIFIDMDQIVRCEGQNMYSNIYTLQGKVLSSFSLRQLSLALPEEEFFQAHKSHIISLRQVKSFHVRDSVITMSDGAELPISRRRKSAFLDHFVRISRNPGED